MPPPRHEAINRLFREQPTLAVEILRDLMDVDVPLGLPVRLEDERPGTVITVGPPRKPVYGIVVEVGWEKSDAGRARLSRCAAALWVSLRCPVTVLCVCPDAEVAGWYAEPLRTELAGFVFRPAVLGPGEPPAITSPADAADRPGFAVLSVMNHEGDRRVAETFLATLELLTPEGVPRSYEHAYGIAAPAARRILGESVASSPRSLFESFAREHYRRGRGDGRAAGEAEAVLRVLAARRIEVPEDARARIRACTDTRLLDVWLDRAVGVATVAELFDWTRGSRKWPVYSPLARENYGRGKKEGRAEGEAEAVLKLLAARRIEVPDDARARIRACTDTRLLDVWLDRVASAASVAELFD